MRSTLLPTAACLAAVAALAGCGGDDEKSSRVAAASTPAATAVTPELPPELVGTWGMRLDVSELEDVPNELLEAAPKWSLAIQPEGGIDNGPTFTLSNGELGSIVSPAPSVDGDRLTLTDGSDVCEDGKPLAHAFTFAIDGEQLTLTPDGNSCDDEPGVVEEILSGNPWRRE